MTWKATDVKLIKLEDEILVGYKGYNSTYFYCQNVKKKLICYINGLMKMGILI